MSNHKNYLVKPFSLGTMLLFFVFSLSACQETSSDLSTPTAQTQAQTIETHVNQTVPPTSTKPAAIVEITEQLPTAVLETEVPEITVTHTPTTNPTDTATPLPTETPTYEPTATTAVIESTPVPVKVEAEMPYFIFGNYCGMCPPMKAFKVEGGKLYKETTLDTFFPENPLYTHGNFEEMPTASTAVLDLPSQIPAELFAESARIIGQPDFVDQGGFYIETNIGGSPQIWQIDTFKLGTPDYLHQFVDALTAVVIELQEE